MGRKATVDEADLLCRLSNVFRDVGYEAATLTMLAQATGLQKASLYHRFPEGKEQMAREVLQDAAAWLADLAGVGEVFRRQIQELKAQAQVHRAKVQALLVLLVV